MLDTMLKAEEIEPIGSEGSCVSWYIAGTVCVIVVLSVIIDWIWWDYNIRDLRHIPTSKCERHLLMTYRVLASINKNKIADCNVCK